MLYHKLYLQLFNTDTDYVQELLQSAGAPHPSWPPVIRGIA